MKEGLPPMIEFHGTDDEQVPVWTAQFFETAMKRKAIILNCIHLREGSTIWGMGIQNIHATLMMKYLRLQMIFSGNLIFWIKELFITVNAGVKLNLLCRYQDYFGFRILDFGF